MSTFDDFMISEQVKAKKYLRDSLDTITDLRSQLAQAQASLAASRAQALEEAAKLTEGFKHYYSTLDSQGMTSVRENVYANTVTIARKIRALIAPSDSAALARLLARREVLEQLIIDMRAIGKMLGEHQLASVCEDYARRAATAQTHRKCKASAANTGANDPQDCDWPTCGCDPDASDPASAKLRDDQIKHMVNRFLNWRLPENFNPDAGISFKAAFNEHTAHPMKHEPTGTNLLDATQAEEMVRHLVDGMPGTLPCGDVAKLFAEERLEELNLIPQSEHWSTGLEGYIMRRKDTLAARVAELKGKKGVKS